MKGWADRFTCPSEINVLDWESWDVSELKGKSARIQIVDRRRRDWGHISVDHIYQSDVASKYVQSRRPREKQRVDTGRWPATVSELHESKTRSGRTIPLWAVSTYTNGVFRCGQVTYSALDELRGDVFFRLMAFLHLAICFTGHNARRFCLLLLTLSISNLRFNYKQFGVFRA